MARLRSRTCASRLPSSFDLPAPIVAPSPGPPRDVGGCEALVRGQTIELGAVQGRAGQLRRVIIRRRTAEGGRRAR